MKPRAWAHRASVLGLAPLLVLQGIYARWRTPTLGEAAGPRHGRCGSGPSLRLLVAGDSAAAGVGVALQDQALAGRAVAALGCGFDVHWQLVARTGYTTLDLLRHLERLPAADFDAAVISLGTNDLTSGVRLSTWLARQRQLVDMLRTRHGVSQVILSSVAPLQDLRALPQPLRSVLGSRARRFNAAQAQAVAQWPGCEVVTLSLDAVEGALASDGFHPGWQTYWRWGGEVAARLCERRAGSPAGSEPGASRIRSP